jgi:hypothetical protein
MKIFQLGVCKGNDDLTEIIKNKDIDLLVLVEPLDFHNSDIEKCYSHIKNKHIENIAVSIKNDATETSFYYHKNDGPLYEVASLDKSHILKHGYDEDGIIEKKIACQTINGLFDRYNINTIDILFIDTEGLDDGIIQTIDFSRFNILNIYFENLHLKSNVYNYLENNHYKIIKNTGTNGWTSLAQKTESKRL